TVVHLVLTNKTVAQSSPGGSPATVLESPGVRIGMYVMLSDYRHWLEYDSVALAVLLVGIGLVELIVLRVWGWEVAGFLFLFLGVGGVFATVGFREWFRRTISVVSMIPTLSASWPSHSIARAIFCRFNSETVITCAERSPRTLSVTLMTAKVIRRASPTLPSSPFFGNPVDW